MAEARCEVTELLADQCAHCRPEPPKPMASGPTIKAQFDGHCACGCGKAVAEGAEITHSNEAGGWCLSSHVQAQEMP